MGLHTPLPPQEHPPHRHAPLGVGGLSESVEVLRDLPKDKTCAAAKLRAPVRGAEIVHADL
jgi:hypothetical protein